MVKNLKIFKLNMYNYKKIKGDQESLGDFNCSICFDPMKLEDMIIETFCDKEVEYKVDEIIVKKKIQHTFHSKCILTWLGAGHLTCPLCRTNLYFKLT